jgi:putative membrane protein
MFAAALLLHAQGYNWNEWKLYPSFMIGWLLLGAAYFLLIGPLRRYFPGSEPVPAKKVGFFAIAMAMMLLSLQGPMHELSDYYLFSVHMVQHLVLILLMPPFLLAAIPDWMLRPVVKIRPVGKAAYWLTRPLAAFMLNNFIFGAWHFPGPYDLMMRNHDVHIAMHLMIMVTGVIMWWPVGSPLPELPRIAQPLQMIYLFVLGIPMMITAALITFSQNELYTWYVAAPRIFDLSPLDDQRLGGILMWVPGALVLWTGITFVWFRWSRSQLSEQERMTGVAEAEAKRGLVISPPPFPGTGGRESAARG